MEKTMRNTLTIDLVTALIALAGVALVIHRLMFVMSPEACWTVCG